MWRWTHLYHNLRRCSSSCWTVKHYKAIKLWNLHKFLTNESVIFILLLKYIAPTKLRACFDIYHLHLRLISCPEWPRWTWRWNAPILQLQLPSLQDCSRITVVRIRTFPVRGEYKASKFSQTNSSWLVLTNLGLIGRFSIFNSSLGFSLAKWLLFTLDSSFISYYTLIVRKLFRLVKRNIPDYETNPLL